WLRRIEVARRYIGLWLLVPQLIFISRVQTALSVMPKCLLFSVCLAFITPGLAAPSVATIDGSVVNKMSGAPIKNAHVIYTRTSPDAGASSPVSTDTDVEGHFTLQLEHGTY